MQNNVYVLVLLKSLRKKIICQEEKFIINMQTSLYKIISKVKFLMIASQSSVFIGLQTSSDIYQTLP